MAKEISRIYPCFPSRSAAPSAAPISRYSPSPQPPVESTGAKPLARRAMLSGTQLSTFPALAVPGDLRSTRAPRNPAASAESSSLCQSSAFPVVRPRRRTLSTEATARCAAQSVLCSGTRTTPNAPSRISARRTWQRTTASPWRTMTRFCGSNAACAPSAAKTNRTLMGGTGRSSDFRWITAMRPAECAVCSARSATGQSASSATIRSSCGKRSATCCATARTPLNDGGLDLLPSIHPGGQ